jgi:hypothetical protein
MPGSEIEDFRPVHERKAQQHRNSVAALRGLIPVKTQSSGGSKRVLWDRVSTRNPCRQQDVRRLDRSGEGPPYRAASSSALGRGVHFLARDAASYIKGQVWAVNGDMYI